MSAMARRRGHDQLRRPHDEPVTTEPAGVRRGSLPPLALMAEVPSALLPQHLRSLQRSGGNHAATVAVQRGKKKSGGTKPRAAKKTPTPTAADDWLAGTNVNLPRKNQPARETNKERKRRRAREAEEADRANLRNIAADPNAIVDATRDRLMAYAAAEQIEIAQTELEDAVAELVLLAAQTSNAADEGTKTQLAKDLRSQQEPTYQRGVESLAPKLAERDRVADLETARDSIVRAGLNRARALAVHRQSVSDGVDLATGRERLQKALDAQRKPSVQTWLRHLGLWVEGGRWAVQQIEVRHEGMKMHRTFDNDAARQPGAVNEFSADELMSRMFATVNTFAQNHVTLEVAGSDYPHVYWDETPHPNGYHLDWVLARAALKEQLNAWKDELRPKIQEAIDCHGDI